MFSIIFTTNPFFYVSTHFSWYSSPLLVSPGTPLKDETIRSVRSLLAVDGQRSVDTSLNKAIRAARHMKVTSGRMAHCLATGLHRQQLVNSLHGLKHHCDSSIN